MKKSFFTLALCCFAYLGFAQCSFKGYEVKAENAYTNYNVRWATGPEDAKHYTTDRLRKEYLIEKVFAPGEVNWTYTLFDGSSSVEQSLRRHRLNLPPSLLSMLMRVKGQVVAICSTTVSSV